VYVKTSTVRRGDRVYQYLSLVEAYREGGKVRHELVARLGEASELRATGQLDRIIAALRQHAEGTWLAASELSADADVPSVGDVAVVRSYFSRLELDRHFGELGDGRRAKHLGDAVLVMVANRLIDPRSKRRTITDWAARDVAFSGEVVLPSLDQCYHALDVVADAKEETESHCYGVLTNLANLDLRLCCYDLTSTYLEGDPRPSARFSSKAFGYSRDHRFDRPQVMVGLLTTTDGLPIAHHVFPGDTADVATLPGVAEDLCRRFAVSGLTLVADRGLISEDNLAILSAAGLDYVIASRLHRDAICREALLAATSPQARWLPVEDASSGACEVKVQGRRAIVVASPERYLRDRARTFPLVERTETKLLALEERVRRGDLVDPGKIGRAAQRIMSSSGVAGLFDLEIAKGRFLYHYDEAAMDYERDLLAGRFVLLTSLPQERLSTEDVLRTYRGLLGVEDRFRELKDFLGLRPVRHFTESRVRGHIAICVLAATIESLIAADLRHADVRDPDKPGQVISARRALRELHRVRLTRVDAGERSIELVTRRTSLQAKILAALRIDTSSWDRATIA
jgi:Transposase DDE domain